MKVGDKDIKTVVVISPATGERECKRVEATITKVGRKYYWRSLFYNGIPYRTERCLIKDYDGFDSRWVNYSLQKEKNYALE